MPSLLRGAKSRAKALMRTMSLHAPPSLDDRYRALRELTGRADRSLFAGDSLTPYELRVFSQNGEDGVTVEILNRIGVTDRYFVEFGVETGHQANCVLLADVFGWSGLFMEGDPRLAARLAEKYRGTQVATREAMIEASNLERLLDEAQVPMEFDVLSIDIDGNDVHVWRSLKRYRPRLVIVEYNSMIGGLGAVSQPYDPGRAWDGTSSFGSSIAGLEVAAREKGYSLVHTDLQGVNAFFVRDDLLPLLGDLAPPRRNQNLGLVGITHPFGTPPGGWEPRD